jgi:hypothetical protein
MDFKSMKNLTIKMSYLCGVHPVEYCTRKNLSEIYRQSQLRILLMLLHLSVSQHVSAPTGHPQVNTIII